MKDIKVPVDLDDLVDAVKAASYGQGVLDAVRGFLDISQRITLAPSQTEDRPEKELILMEVCENAAEGLEQDVIGLVSDMLGEDAPDEIRALRAEIEDLERKLSDLRKPSA